MAKRIIFLDFGGVLDSVSMLSNPKLKVTKTGFPFDRRCVSVLNEVLARVSDAEIVICSAARSSSSLEQMQGWLKAAGFDYVDRVIGVLDPAETRNQRAIESWLEANAGVEHFAILDDFRPAYSPALVERIPKTLTSSVGLAGVMPSEICRLLGANV